MAVKGKSIRFECDEDCVCWEFSGRMFSRHGRVSSPLGHVRRMLRMILMVN